MELKEMKKMVASWQAEQELKNQKLIDNIDVAKERVLNKDKVISELQHERKLLFRDFLEQLNALRQSPLNIFWYYNEDALWNAWRSQSCMDVLEREVKDGKITEEDIKSYKKNLKTFAEEVKKVFFKQITHKEDIKFNKIYSIWTVGYTFVFEYTVYKPKKHNILIEIFVPNFRADDEKDYIYALSGYSVNFRLSEDACSSTFIANSLRYEDVEEKLYEWILNDGWIEEELEREELVEEDE